MEYIADVTKFPAATANKPKSIMDSPGKAWIYILMQQLQYLKDSMPWLVTAVIQVRGKSYKLFGW